MINLELLYKKETGKNASYEKEDPNNCNRTDIVNTVDYQYWVEDKLIELMERINHA